MCGICRQIYNHGQEIGGDKHPIERSERGGLSEPFSRPWLYLWRQIPITRDQSLLWHTNHIPKHCINATELLSPTIPHYLLYISYLLHYDIWYYYFRIYMFAMWVLDKYLWYISRSEDCLFSWRFSATIFMTDHVHCKCGMRLSCRPKPRQRLITESE